MSLYHYTAKKGPSEIVKDTVVAESRDKAVAMLEAMGYFPITVVEMTPVPASEARPKKILAEKKEPRFAPRVGSHDLDTFLWQLASLMKSSIPLLRALALIAKQTKNKMLKTIVEDLESRIRQGELLSEAMGQYPGIFNNLTMSMIRTGEKSGSLDEVLRKLAEHREKEQEMKRKIQSALAYPMMVVVTGVGTIFLMFTFFLPKLTKLFSGMKQELPLPTKLLIATSGFMSRYWYVFIIGLVFLIAMIVRKSGSKNKLAIDGLTLQIPFLNKFVTTSEIARFSRSLGLLLKNGIPVHDSLPLATNTLDNLVLRARLVEASEAIINRGCTLSESFNRSGIFPEFLLSMIAVGEESGKLEESLEQIASSYEKEVDQTIKIMVSMVEPLLILSVGGIVGFIVFAMLLPILNMGGMGQ